MRVAFDFTPVRLNPAGTGRYARGIATALAAEPGVELIAVEATRRSPHGPAGRALLGLHRELVHYPALLDRRARALGADVIHVPAALGPLRPRTPTFVSIHDVLPLRQPELFTRVNTIHARTLLRLVARSATRVLTGSEHARGEIIELLGLDPGRVEAIPYGIDPVFGPREVDDERLARRYGLRRPYVLATGTLEPRKNLRAVLDALPALPDGVQLAVAGGHGWRAAEIEHALERHAGRAVRLGFVSDEALAELYSGAACFVFPSLSEGFGLPPLEAMACGAPVVCTDRTSVPEIVGDGARLVDPEDVSAIAAAVNEVLGDPPLAADLAARGRARAATFTWKRAAARTRAAYAATAG